mgnify:CR=1 FL=1|tara:strand:+ start:1544 stop:2311 length:768 start_codon:yes stop_codon:yes gene_type:complete
MITSILQYSTMDLRFLKTNLEQLSKFSDEILVVMCTHLFNGEMEDEKLLQQTYAICEQHPKAHIHTFEWQGINQNPGYYHNVSRLLGTQVASGEWLLFVDADEIVSDNFGDWFNKVKHTDNTFWLTCHWYFREPIYQSTSLESAGLLIKKTKCNWNVEVRSERQQLFGIEGFVNGDHQCILHNNEPLIDHYSWVRSEDEMLKKVRNWGHKGDKRWVELVKEEFSRPFNGTDFVHGYQYTKVSNKLKLSNTDENIL